MMARNGIAQQLWRTGCVRDGGYRAAQRPQGQADQRTEHRHGRDDPDQVDLRDIAQQEATHQRADREGGRAPQPQRSIAEAELLDAAQRIGVGERHHRRPDTTRQRIDREQHERLVLGADHGKAERGRCSRSDDRAAQHLTPFRHCCDQRQHGEARHRRHRRDDADPGGIDADRLHPHREKRQVNPGHAEQRGIECRKAARRSPRCNFCCNGDL